LNATYAALQFDQNKAEHKTRRARRNAETTPLHGCRNPARARQEEGSAGMWVRQATSHQRKVLVRGWCGWPLAETWHKRLATNWPAAVPSSNTATWDCYRVPQSAIWP